MAATHTNERACAVICETLPRVDDVRKVCDPAFPRWMPHINLLYPFLNHTQTTPLMLKRARAALRGVEPFTVRFDSVAKFDQAGGTRASIHLHPDEKSRQLLRGVFNTLVQFFGSVATSRAANFEPHMTIAVWPVPATANLPATCRTAKDFCKLCQDRFKGIEVPVDEIVIMDRNPMRGVSLSDGSGFGFRVLERLQLGGAEIKAARVTKLTRRCITDAAQVGPAVEVVRARLLEVAVRRAGVCLRRMVLQRKVPKSLNALLALLKPFTKQRVLVDEKKALARMRQLGLLVTTTEMRRAPSGTAPPPEVAPPPPGARGGRGMVRGRGRGGRPAPAPPKPSRPKVAVEVVRLQPAACAESVKGWKMSTVLAGAAGDIHPFGPTFAQSSERRLAVFANRLAQHQGKQAMPLAAFRKMMRDVCVAPVLVPVDGIVEKLQECGALVALPNEAEQDEGRQQPSVSIDISRLPQSPG